MIDDGNNWDYNIFDLLRGEFNDMMIRIYEDISYGKELKNFFFEANVKSFLDAVKYGVVKSYDQAFDIKVWKLTFEEYYHDGLFGGGTAKAERIARRASKEYLRHLESIKTKLPSGIAMRIEEAIYPDRIKSSTTLRVVFSVVASVTAEYSKNCHTEISEDNIAHDWDMPANFISAAKAFKDKILVSKNELIHAIEVECNRKYRSDVAFYESRYCNYSDCWGGPDSTYYESQGMVNLHGIEQCYGLAWAVATLAPPTNRYLIKIVDDDPLNHFSYSRGPNGQKTKVARLERFVKVSSSKQLTEW